MTTNDIRWQQRLVNFDKALSQLADAVDLSNTRALSNLEAQGLIQAFEYNYELAWNTLKDFYQYQGITDLQDSRDAIRFAFKQGLIKNGEQWMAMIQSRTLTSHTYNQSTADKIVIEIIQVYYPEFKALSHALNEIANAPK